MTGNLSGDVLMAGAPGHNDESGAAYIFRKPVSGWKTSSRFNAELTAKAADPAQSSSKPFRAPVLICCAPRVDSVIDYFLFADNASRIAGHSAF